MIEKEASKKSKTNKEKGAAMVMALLISFLLLLASAGLLLEASMNTANVTDATAEQQAYNAAESGIQTVVNVLRGHVAPSPLLDSTKPATDLANKINFVRAMDLGTSNVPSDTTGVPRLSRWLRYHNSPNDRVVLGVDGVTTASYNPRTGYAFSIVISDPDNTGTFVSYTTTGRFFDSNMGDSSTKTYNSSWGGSLTFRYTPTTVSNINVAGGATSTNFGTFTVDVPLLGGAPIPAFNRFEITVNMTRPYLATRVIRGYIQTNTCTLNVCTIPKIIFDSQTFTLLGSTITLNFGWGSPANVYDLGPPQRVGYEAQLGLGANVVTGTMSSPEPTRLVIRSTGYGPRGATKQLEAIIQKNFMSGLTAPATLTLVGPAQTTNPATSFTFNPGTSNETNHSGDDTVSTDIIAPIGTTDPSNLEAVEASVDGQPPHPYNGTVVGSPSNVSTEIPPWLSSPLALDTMVHSLYNIALASGRYFPSGQTPTSFGNEATATGITFCDGNVSFTGSGGGILVVTGKLTLSGNFSFNGLIIVTGQEGVGRTGGGNGTIQGNMVVAPYLYSPVSDGLNPTATQTFLSPQYNLSGGGSSTITYNSSSVANGLTAVSNFVLGVAEK